MRGHEEVPPSIMQIQASNLCVGGVEGEDLLRIQDYVLHRYFLPSKQLNEENIILMLFVQLN